MPVDADNLLCQFKFIGFGITHAYMWEDLECAATEHSKKYVHHIDGLEQERRNCIALAIELHLSCSNPSIGGLVPLVSCNNIMESVGVLVIA